MQSFYTNFESTIGQALKVSSNCATSAPTFILPRFCWTILQMSIYHFYEDFCVFVLFLFVKLISPPQLRRLQPSKCLLVFFCSWLWWLQCSRCNMSVLWICNVASGSFYYFFFAVNVWLLWKSNEPSITTLARIPPTPISTHHKWVTQIFEKLQPFQWF